MRIHVRYFASIREQIGRADEAVEIAGTPRVGDVWAQVQGQPGGRVLAAVNQEYVAWDHALNEGDELAFFPPVTGG